MSADYGDRLRTAFDEVMNVEAAGREPYARSHYADDEQLLGDLLEMIGTLGTESSFLEPLDETDVRVLLGSATESSGWPDEALPDLGGHVLVGRYRLGRKIGSGGASVVHEGVDELQDRPVAVKVLRRAKDRSRAKTALRRETTTLRLLRLPGVVQLHDEGVETIPDAEGVAREYAFLVTERVEGNPFPGDSGVRAWEALERVTVALLESLERMHRAGIVHGDLKPGNVLVRPDGVPVILDLGIAEGPRAAAREHGDHARRGTLRYMAPEQVGGGLPTPRSDLYAVGMMLFEALSGSPYRSDATVELVRIGVIEENRRPLDESATDVPPHVRETVERLLAHDPEARPGSAAEVLDALRSRAAPRPLPIEAPPGAVLDAEQLKPLFVGPDRLLHLQEDAAAELWRRTRGEADRLVDELDAWSRAGLGYWDDGIYHLRRLDIEQLQQTIHPFAARRPRGDVPPALEPFEREVLLVVELAGVRATPDLLAAVLRAELGVVRSTLERLEGQDLVLGDASGTLRLPFLPEGVAEEFVGKERRRLHARIATHLPKGDPRRLPHLIEAGRYDRVPKESLRVARTLLEEGDAGGARAMADLGLSVLASTPDPGPKAVQALKARQKRTDRLLEVRLQTAMVMSSKPALDDYLHRLGRWPPGPRLEVLERIAAGILHALDGQPGRALEEFPNPDEIPSGLGRRLSVSGRLFAGRLLRDDSFLVEVERAERLAESDPEGPVAAAATSARAWLAYQDRRYDEASTLHRRVARTTPIQTTQIAAMLNAASSYLDGGRFSRAESIARRALERARARRHAFSEGRAEYYLRAAAYRRGDGLEPDLELAAAARALGPSQLGGLINLTEAAIAWRGGLASVAHDLAEAAVRLRRGTLTRGGLLLARSLAAVTGPPPGDDAARALLAACEACPSPKKAAQAAALLGRACPSLAEEALGVARTKGGEVDPASRDFRLEVLSIAEAMKSPSPERVTGE